MKINLDKYYTDEKIAKHCIDTFWKHCFGVTDIIEPSAGAGAFSLQIPNCTAYDLEPEHESIIKQDFLELNLPYKQGRAFIGNPPFGARNSLSVKFFKHAVKMCDMIAFILPVSQYNNTQQMYEFDLIHSEVLPLIEYSGRKLLCCYNIYHRPQSGKLNTSPIKYNLKDVSVTEYRRGGTYPKPLDYDYGMCAWGNVGKEVDFVGQFAQENYIKVNNHKYKDAVLNVIKRTDWKNLYPCISTPKIQTWKIYKYLKEQIPELDSDVCLNDSIEAKESAGKRKECDNLNLFSEQI